ncbi:hypothetical protein [Methylocystis sp.]|uniref:hypothetical protein n=1 Tax=Methylocystis sp. TaxID=1911079 RepID=UPI0025D06D63|nr:hypothetical protein [Methylocystis sp.]
MTAHIANGTTLYIEEQNEITDVGTMRASLSAATVLSQCAKNNVQTNTSFAQRKASGSSLYLAIQPLSLNAANQGRINIQESSQ